MDEWKEEGALPTANQKGKGRRRRGWTSGSCRVKCMHSLQYMWVDGRLCDLTLRLVVFRPFVLTLLNSVDGIVIEMLESEVMFLLLLLLGEAGQRR